MCVATVTGLWIDRHFVQAIIHEDQTAVGDSEFGNTYRLRSEVKSDQARRSGHSVKGLNRNSKIQKVNFYREIQPCGMRCSQRVRYTCALSPDFMRLRRTEHVVFNAFANCRLICRAPSANHHRLDDKPIHLFAALGPLHAYLENG